MTDSPKAAPITEEYFGARLAALGVEKSFAVAVSGGRDSMALARLSAAYGKNKGIAVMALTVDHGLRPEAADEAAKVSAWCKAAGLEHRTLVWEGVKPATGVQNAARRARYRMLAQAANDAGVDAILTAHNADDQAETVFMRLARGAGPKGLSAMRESGWIADGAGSPVRLLRPLLSVPRAQLTATAAAFDQPYVDDPSNDDPSYERIKTRALMAALEEQGLLTQNALLRMAGRMQVASRLLKEREDALFQTLSGCFFRWGGVCVDLHKIAAMATDDVSGLCRRLIFAVCGQDYAPDAEAVSEAFNNAITTGAATLGGALLKAHGERLWFLREPAALLGRAGSEALAPVSVNAGKAVLWDNRFIITVPSGQVDAAISPLGVRSAPSGAFDRAISAPDAARAAMPGVYCDGVLIGAPDALFNANKGVSFTSLCSERFAGEIIRFS